MKREGGWAGKGRSGKDVQVSEVKGRVEVDGVEGWR